MKILVLKGGDSTEREVSLRSSAAVEAALLEVGYIVASYDPLDGDEGLTNAVKDCDVVLPILHGDNGEDGVIQQKLEALNAKFLGSTSEASRVCISKTKTHEVLGQAGILMPRYEIVNKETVQQSELYKSPFVLKTIDGGSSVDIYIARDSTTVDSDKINSLLQRRGSMLMEELIFGQEITVGVLGDRVLPIVAITPPVDGEFDYENKYNGSTKEVCPVPDEIISLSKQAEAQELAQRVHTALGARHLSRTDMIITDDGSIYVLELNTMPGLTDQSLFPKEAKTAGMTMVELVKRFVEMAVAS